MNLCVKIVVAKELRRIGIAIAVAALGFVVMLVVGLYYEKQEYANYLKTKVEVEAEVAEWKKEALKERDEQAFRKEQAFMKMKIFVLRSNYLSRCYDIYKQNLYDNVLRQGLLGTFEGKITLSENIYFLDFVDDMLANKIYNDDIRELGLLMSIYKSESPRILSDMDLMMEEKKRLSQVSSFDNYREKYLGDYYPFVRRSPPIESAFVVFISILMIYFYVRLLVFVVQLVISFVKWVNKTSKLHINNTEENGGK